MGLLFVLAPQAWAQEAQRDDAFKALQDRIQALEDEIDYYRQEMEARQALMPKEEETEKQQKTEEVLKASEEESAQYVLLKERTIEMRYSLSYSHSTFDRVLFADLDVERETYYTFTNSLSVSYGLMERISLSGSVPYVYKYQQTGSANEESDLGDVSAGASWQTLKESQYRPAVLLSMNYSAPTGKSPFRIDPARELSTGSGSHSFSLGVNLSKVLDPVIAFGGLNFDYALEVTNIDQKRFGAILESVSPGYSVGYAMGLGFALSYNTSVSFRFSASHNSRTEYVVRSPGAETAQTFQSDEDSSASFIIGTGWRVTPKTSVNISLGYGLVGGQDYSLSVSVPFSFTL